MIVARSKGFPTIVGVRINRTRGNRVDKAVVHQLTGFPLIIPLRRTIEHAAALRRVADPIVVAVELTDGTMGHGETVPRPYVTGETTESVLAALTSTLAPAVVEFNPESFPDALEAIEALPWHDTDGRLLPAARAGVELALLDAAMRRFDRGMDAVVQWMGLPGFGYPGSSRRIRFTGVLAAEGIEATLRELRLMHWGGVRDVKLMVGLEREITRVERVAGYLRRPLANRRATLRLDANGVWSPDDAGDWLARVSHLPIAAIEQPLSRDDIAQLPSLRERSNLPIVHDESLVTIEDAKALIDLGVADAFNIGISKCGGLMPSLRLAALAHRSGVRVQLGCMTGETSVLAAAGLRFLEVCPDVAWAEGCHGSFRLTGDIVETPLRFGYGGQPPRLSPRAPGLGMTVDPNRLRGYCEGEPLVFHL